VMSNEARAFDWLEVSLTVNGELAEAVAELLARFAPNGVMTEQGVEFVGEEDEGTASGPITVRAYLPADSALEATRHKLEESLHYLGMIQPLPAPAYRQIAEQNWMHAWKQHYGPIRIGRRLVIVPAWMDAPEPDRVPVKIDPGMAFGTGTHPSTQLCLELLEEQFASSSILQSPSSILHTPSTIIDIGCGSGILSIAALKLGAQQALGVDTDVQSLENARANADLNGVADKLHLAPGSVAEILIGQFVLSSAPVVVANIFAPVLIRLLDAGLADLVDHGGALILGGILQEQAPRVIDAANSKGLKLLETRQRTDWIALALQRQGSSN